MESVWVWLLAIFYGILEGITEWLPVSSTGHLILLREWLPLPVSEAFWEVFQVCIQLGAVLAVPVCFWRRLWPGSEDLRTVGRRWGKILLACLPAAVLGFLLDDWLDATFYRYQVVAGALIFYGVLFWLIERGKRAPGIEGEPDGRRAFGIGCFQVLSLIPGTSRSGSTILGGMLLGLSRRSAATFSFWLAVPIMLGASGLKLVKFVAGQGLPGGYELGLLALGSAAAFLVSVTVIRFLTAFVSRHSFRCFALYRIALGAAVFLYFGLK